jgi:Zn-dependent M28 family amino/carboxypeptidase
VKSRIQAALLLAAWALGGEAIAQESRSRYAEPVDAGEASINAEDILKHLEFLASDEMKGRRTGSDEEKLAGEYIVKHFQTCGLKPAGEEKGYKQKFRAVAFTGTNIIGVLPGSSQVKAGEYVAVGAHYDHVGLGNFGSRTNSSGQIHNGADDNASGTSALLELVEAFSKKPTKRSLLFLAFSGEEMGLIGSHAWCEKPTRPLARIAAMVNLDMVGRCTNDWLYVGGVGTSKSFPDLIRKQAEKFPFRIEMGPGGTGPSDFESFYKKDIPVLFFFTGLHEQYHSPADKVALINTADEAGVAKLAYRVIQKLADDDKRPQFVKDDRKAMPEKELTEPERQRPRIGITIGEAAPNGAPITAVEAKSPAEESGIKEGDVLVSLNGLKPKHDPDLLSIVGLIPEKTPVKVVLVRDGKSLTKSVLVK